MSDSAKVHGKKLQLLYSYLTERFTYTEEQTQTPIYSLLCEGYATSWSMAQCWALFAREAGSSVRL